MTYHVDPVPDHPERWSGTIRTPPIKVKFYRMKAWSLFDDEATSEPAPGTSARGHAAF